MYKDKDIILIVDDNPTTSKILMQILDEDYDSIIAEDGKSALSLAENSNVDIILLDVIMPDMDGFEVCRQLKQHPKTQEIPVVFITSLSEEEDEYKGLEIGAIDYITKPFCSSIVKARIKNHLELKHYRDTLKNLSYIEELTGILNRRFFDEYYMQAWNRAVEKNKLVSVIMTDIDFFKEYNDHYGHLLGDDCLKAVAISINNVLKNSSHIVARYGGDEFISVVSDATLDDSFLIAQKIQNSVLELKLPHDSSKVSNIVTLTLSVGSIFPKKADNPNDFLAKVDLLLYEAKKNGRNQIKSNYITL